MTRQEINDWIKTADFVFTEYCEIDSDGHAWARDIYRTSDGKYYAVETINGQTVSQIETDKNGKAIQNGEYRLKKVRGLA